MAPVSSTLELATRQAADLLLQARATRTLITTEPFALRDQAQAYAIQSEVVKALGPRLGWKLAFGKDGKPVRAPLMQSLLQASPATLQRNQFERFLIESELAVVFAKAMPARADAYSLDDVLANIQSLNAAIETVDSRFLNWPKVEPLWGLADGLSHGSFILGSGIPFPDISALNRAGFELRLDGTTIKQGEAPHPSGNPGQLLQWLANTLADQGDAITAGDIVTLGTFTGATPMTAGQSAWVGFDGIGEVSLQLR